MFISSPFLTFIVSSSTPFNLYPGVLLSPLSYRASLAPQSLPPSSLPLLPSGISLSLHSPDTKLLKHSNFDFYLASSTTLSPPPLFPPSHPSASSSFLFLSFHLLLLFSSSPPLLFPLFTSFQLLFFLSLDLPPDEHPLPFLYFSTFFLLSFYLSQKKTSFFLPLFLLIPFLSLSLFHSRQTSFRKDFYLSAS